MNGLSLKKNVCTSASEVVYSNKIHLIFCVINIPMDPYINKIIQKIWERDVETITTHKYIMSFLLEKFQLIKNYVNEKNKKGLIVSEDIRNLWEYVIPVVEGNILYILEINEENLDVNQNQDQSPLIINNIQTVVARMILNNLIPIHQYSPNDLLDIISDQIATGSTVIAQDLILQIQNIELRLNILIQIILQEIDKGHIEYAKNFCNQAIHDANQVPQEKDILIIMSTLYRLQNFLYNQH